MTRKKIETIFEWVGAKKGIGRFTLTEYDQLGIAKKPIKIGYKK